MSPERRESSTFCPSPLKNKKETFKKPWAYSKKVEASPTKMKKKISTSESPSLKGSISDRSTEKKNLKIGQRVSNKTTKGFRISPKEAKSPLFRAKKKKQKSKEIKSPLVKKAKGITGLLGLNKLQSHDLPVPVTTNTTKKAIEKSKKSSSEQDDSTSNNYTRKHSSFTRRNLEKFGISNKDIMIIEDVKGEQSISPKKS